MQTAETKTPAGYDPRDFVGDERAEMASMYEETLKHFTEGSIVQGCVLGRISSISRGPSTRRSAAKRSGTPAKTGSKRPHRQP